MRKICVITATRAEYGLLKPIMELLKLDDEFQLQVVATGAHLSPEFGLTYKQIEADGFNISEKVEVLMSSDTSVGLVKTMGITLISLADTFSRLSPDLVLLLGDRYETLAIASAATIFRIPIAHIHGGEITEGAYDDAIRHAITKLSHLHFTSTESYKQRVIQMGEQPARVFNVGAIGLDNIRKLKLLGRQELEESLGIKFQKFIYQVTFHPETLGKISSAQQFQILLDAISVQEESTFVFTKANADTDGRIINQMIDKFVARSPQKSASFHSLGSLRFLSLVSISTAIIGNSSSGIIEAPSLHTATINIGDRQRGRIQADSILNVPCETDKILDAFKEVANKPFFSHLESVVNPYDNGGAAEIILSEIRKLHTISAEKSFYNIL